MDYGVYDASTRTEPETSKDIAVTLTQKDHDIVNGQSEENQGHEEINPQALLDSSMRFYKEAQRYWNSGDNQKALDALDKAYVALAQINANGDRDLEKKKEDIRLMISKRIQEINASKCKTINGSNCAIPITMNEDVQREINLLLGPQRKWFIKAYKRSGKFREDIAKACKNAGLPEELSWLPLIESGFNARAISRAHAVGLWQLIPSTGYRFGLKRDTWIDERMDPEKSTQAAITYLKNLHDMFGDWTTVLAAYNCGEATVSKTIREQKISYLDNFWDLYKRLPKESACFVPRFLAVLELVKHPEKYNLDLTEPDEPLPAEEVILNKQVHLKSLADKLGIYYDELVALNPELRQNVTPNTTYRLKVPYGKANELLAEIDNIPQWSPPTPETRLYPRNKTKEGRFAHSKKNKKETEAKAGLKHISSHKSMVKIASLKHKNINISTCKKASNSVTTLKDSKVVKKKENNMQRNKKDNKRAVGDKNGEKASSRATNNKGHHATKRDF
ncbi:MAG: lytic transglycosylase domain-containing protein [Dissulfurimicrobium sp.]|uniref:lytic transglycosylase domain-containing protein n=1 Tax=Dissulfurimicrobium sp. TaxID=2022436 RepID=UPI00404B2C77